MKISCPHCSQNYEIDESSITDNSVIHCQSCNREFRVVNSKVDNPNMFSCPDCGKNISKMAVACPNCGRPICQEKKQEPVRVDFPKETVLTRNRGCGDIVIFGPVILLIIIVFYILSKIG